MRRAAHLYSFAFDPYRDARVRYPDQRAILTHLREVTDRHGLRSRLRCNTAVVAADYSDIDRIWALATTTGEVIYTDAVVWALGQPHRPAIPRLRGAQTFGPPATAVGR